MLRIQRHNDSLGLFASPRSGLILLLTQKILFRYRSHADERADNIGWNSNIGGTSINREIQSYFVIDCRWYDKGASFYFNKGASVCISIWPLGKLLSKNIWSIWPCTSTGLLFLNTPMTDFIPELSV